MVRGGFRVNGQGLGGYQAGGIPLRGRDTIGGGGCRLRGTRAHKGVSGPIARDHVTTPRSNPTRPEAHLPKVLVDLCAMRDAVQGRGHLVSKLRNSKPPKP